MPMTGEQDEATAYAEVNAILRDLLAGVQAILAEQFVGMYLYGSLASGDFSPETSDIDFLVVTDGELSRERVDALTALHARLSARPSGWALELEGSYIPRDPLRRYDARSARHLHIDRGAGQLHFEQHDSDWVIQRHILREYGVVLAGPPPAALIDTVEPRAVRDAVLDLLNGWWASFDRDSSKLEHTGYQAYAVLTMCRALYALEHGAIVSKPSAARWALRALGECWRPLIERALAWRDGAPFDDRDSTAAFIRYTVERSRRLAAGKEVTQLGSTNVNE